MYKMANVDYYYLLTNFHAILGDGVSLVTVLTTFAFSWFTEFS